MISTQKNIQMRNSHLKKKKKPSGKVRSGKSSLQETISILLKVRNSHFKQKKKKTFKNQFFIFYSIYTII